MEEYWVNVYHYGAMPDSLPFVGINRFANQFQAISYFPSVGLRVVYRIHVRLK